MPRLVLWLLALGAGTAPLCGQHTEAASRRPWSPLFDGRTLDGWQQRGGAAEYRVEDGAIVGASVPGAPNSFLCTERELADFELELEFAIEPGLNSGIQFRSHSRPGYRRGRVHGYQAEVDTSPRGWTAGVYDDPGQMPRAPTF